VEATVGLLAEFRTVDEAFQDHVVLEQTGHAFHRLDADAHAVVCEGW